MNIIFRVDASIQMGSGHVMRCVTLAKQLLIAYPHAEITFICRSLKGDLISYLQREKIDVLPLNSQAIPVSENQWEWYRRNWQQDYRETYLLIKERPVDLLVVDHYGLDANWESEMQKHVQYVMVIDDLANRNHDCDLLLDQNIQTHAHRYQQLTSENCLLLLGPDYLLLREEFIEQTNKIHIKKGKIENILLFFGGSDPQQLTMRTINLLQTLSWLKSKIQVVTGGANPQLILIEDKCQKDSRFIFYCQIDDMAQMMGQADLMIGAGGTTTWERLYMGLPAIMAVTADNQREVTEQVTRAGTAISLGDQLQDFEQALTEAIITLHREPYLIENMSKRAVHLLNRERIGRYPVLEAIKEVVR